MKKLYKVVLALAISLGCASAFAEGTAVQTTGAVEAAAVEITSYAGTVTVTGAEGETVKIYDLTGTQVATGVDQVTVDAPAGYYIVVVGGVSETVYLD